jgi:DNA polymerase-3 subunit epsilon
LSEPAGLGRALVCIDLETTGGNAAWNRIIEIGLVEIDEDGTEREWSTLVNPGVRIPSQIETFTGITNAMVSDAPPFEVVYRDLLQRLHGRLFIAHNARFDYGFVRAELARVGVNYTSKVLCTVKLSRRLFPKEPRHNLDAVMRRHNIVCSMRHRALGDARVLRDLLNLWCATTAPQVITETVDRLLQETPLPPQLSPSLVDDLPDTPGIYRFFGSDDALLYIGKSQRIRSRVLEHFAAAHRSASERRLATQVQRVTWNETAGELGALLREARAVKSEKPVHNRQLRDSGGSWTVRLKACPGLPAQIDIVMIDELAADEQVEVYGLFRDAKAAARTVDELVRAHELCSRVLGLERGAGAHLGSCFAYQIKRCRGVCVGLESAVLHDTRTRLALAPSRLKSWPYSGRVAVIERDWRGEQDVHVLSHWRYYGTVRDLDDARAMTVDSVGFDADIYRILKRFLNAPGTATLVEL